MLFGALGIGISHTLLGFTYRAGIQGLPILLLTVVSWATVGLRGQSQPKGAEWKTYGGDLASTRYSPLDQITKDNFNKLEVAWRVKTDAFGPRPEFNFQATPLMVDGVVYSTAGTRRTVIALDAGNKPVEKPESIQPKAPARGRRPPSVG